MKTVIRLARGCGILAVGLALAGVASARAQNRVSNDQAPAPDVILVGGNVTVLEVLPWDLPGVARECVVSESLQHRDYWSHTAAFHNRTHGHWHREGHHGRPDGTRARRAVR